MRGRASGRKHFERRCGLSVTAVTCHPWELRGMLLPSGSWGGRRHLLECAFSWKTAELTGDPLEHIFLSRPSERA